MAVTFLSSVTAQVSSAATSISITPPASLIVGDLLIATVCGQTYAQTIPSGWTTIYNHSDLSTAYHVVVGGEPGSWAWTASSVQRWCGGIAAFRGVSPRFNVDATSQQGGAGTTVSYSIVGCRPGNVVMAAVGQTSSGPASFTAWPPSGYTTAHQATDGSATPVTAVGLAYKIVGNVLNETPGNTAIDANTFGWDSATINARIATSLQSTV